VDDQLSAILAEIRPRIGEWYPDAVDAPAPAEPRVTVERDDRRTLNRVVRLLVTAGDTPVARLIVKAENPEPASSPTTDERPRLVPVTVPGQRADLEYDALRLLEDRIATAGDQRFAPIRALAVLEGSRALVMEAFVGRPLHRLLLKSTLRRVSPALRPDALANAAGAWLRLLHDTPSDDSRPIRQGSPEELAERFSAFGEFLARTARPHDFDRFVEIGQAASASLQALPPAIGHGDFAPRNILVDRRGRLAVIDLLARWRSPRYEDVAAFLVAMHTSRANAATQGLLFGRAIDRLEPAFLAGYFGTEPVPRGEIRLFELLLLLDKWSARMIRQATGSGGRVQERLIDRYFDGRSRHLARLLAAEL
jgi:hypothetical protein